MNYKRFILLTLSFSLLIFLYPKTDHNLTNFDITNDRNGVALNYQFPKIGGKILIKDEDTSSVVIKQTNFEKKGYIDCNNLEKNKVYIFSYIFNGKEIIKKEIFIYDYNSVYQNKCIPVIEIKTENEEIPKADILYPEDPESNWGYTTINNTSVNGIISYISDNKLVYSGKMSFKIRGNTSSAGVRKPSYKIKLNKAMDLLFRTTNNIQEKEWNLLNCGNKINTILSSQIAQFVYRGWSPNFKIVSLVLNGNYCGIYLLYENVKSSTKNFKISETGFMIENDAYWWKPNTLYFRTEHQIYPMAYTFIKPKNDKNGNIQSFMDEVDYKISNDYKNLFDEYLDIDSTVDWILSQDLILQQDYAGSNLFIYRKNDISLLQIGPSWDFDATLLDVSPNQFSQVHNMDINGFFPKLFEYSEFKLNYKNRLLSIEISLKKSFDNNISILRENSNEIQNLLNCEASYYGKENYDILLETDRIEKLFYEHLNWMINETEEW